MLTFAVRLILEDNGKMLFLRQTKRNGGRYSLVGGNVEDHEFAREALAREAKEEAGIHVEPDELILTHVLHRHKLKKDENLLVLYFKATRFYGEPESLEPKKFKDVGWFRMKCRSQPCTCCAVSGRGLFIPNSRRDPRCWHSGNNSAENGPDSPIFSQEELLEMAIR